MIREAIILAGGFGMRLRSVVSSLPKPMAEVCGRPFLSYILDFLNKQGIGRVVLSVGYKWEVIKEFFGDRYKEIDLIYAVEDSPLGTGGAIKNALRHVCNSSVFVFNGDTLFDIDLSAFFLFHDERGSKLSIALKKADFTERYGTVEIDSENRIVGFVEKARRFCVLINGGIYLLNKDFFNSFSLQDKFSFERDFLERYYDAYRFYGVPFDGYFIDIGIPEDYERAKREFEKFSH